MMGAVVRRASLVSLSRPILRAAPRPGSSSQMMLKCPSSGSRGGGDETKATSSNNPRSRPEVAKIQHLVGKDPRGGWEECWKEEVTPWDLGQPTPAFLRLLEMGNLPKGRVFIPGCGTGYDVAAIAGPERYVVGLDISETAIKKAQELFGSFENSKSFTFVAADFFTWRPTELFDLIIDYTFFCAIDPCLRVKWASQIRNILKPDGELITLMFPIGDFDGGPPYAVSLLAYEEVLSPVGFKAISVSDNELAVGRRKGSEKLVRWKSTTALSPL